MNNVSNVGLKLLSLLIIFFFFQQLSVGQAPWTVLLEGSTYSLLVVVATVPWTASSGDGLSVSEILWGSWLLCAKQQACSGVMLVNSLVRLLALASMDRLVGGVLTCSRL